jgi:23S rRNA (adenine2503-C2)-methyltransferase
MGFGGNLSDREIIDQIMYFQRWLKDNASDSPINDRDYVTNIVFMGMGEPMLNLEHVQSAIDTITSPQKLAMSSRRITISTSGYVPQFKKLVESGFRGRVAISLHAPNQELRAKMMPVAKVFSLDELLEALDDYVELTNKRVSYEYVMIKNLNDQEVHAEQLVELFANRLAHINLIPYNPIREENFERSKRSQMQKFTDILNRYNVPHSIRVTMGDDVDAACGQLADRENRKHKDKKIRI